MIPTLTRRELQAHMERFSCLGCAHFRDVKRASLRGCVSDYKKCRAGRALSDYPRLFVRKGSVR